MDRRLCFTAVVLLLGVPGATRANLIVNGGFEADKAPSGGYIQRFGGSTLSGWNVLGNDILVLDKNYSEGYQSPTQVFNSNSGDEAVDLTGAGNTGANDGLQQSITTEVGQRYVLSFFVGRASSSPNYQTPSTLDLSIDGAPRQQFTNTNDTPGFINWRPFVVEFVATGLSTSLAFFNGTANVGSLNNYVGLDDVEVVAAPEPSTLISGAMGGLATLMLWRSRRRAAAALS